MHVKLFKTNWHYKIVLLVCAFTLALGSLYAQNIKINGIVVDKNNEPLVGASVLVKGTRTVAIATLDGTFSIDAPGNAILVFTSIGYTSQEIPVRNRTRLDVVLEEDAAVLDAVVVTAEYGLKRTARAIGSAIQSVRATDIVESGRDNFVSALQGRVAGLTISSAGGVPGASTTVVLRNFTSMSGNNQPLYVVDGVPINNSSFDSEFGFAVTGISSRTMDYSSRGNDFNAEDIESMTVLKGAAAAALYGSDASNGAIVITTKKGSSTAGKGRVRYGSSFGLLQSYGLPEIQKTFANGYYGITNYYNTSRFGGRYPDDVKLYDNMNAVLQTGSSQYHTLSVESGTDKLSIRGSASYRDDKGTVKTARNTRFNVSLAGRAEITKWLSFEGNMQYVQSDRNIVPKGTSGPFYRAVRWPMTDDITNYMAPDGTMRTPDLYTDTDLLNPLYGLYKNKNTHLSDNVITSITVKITPVKNTYALVKLGWNKVTDNIISATHPYYSNPSTTSYGLGSFNQSKNQMNDDSINAFVGYNNEWGKFSFVAQAGYHQQENGVNRMSIYGSKFQVIEFYGIQNCDPQTITATTRTTKRHIQGLSASVELGYHNMAFLTLKGRNDWSSTLPKHNNSYFYPCIEGSFIVSDLPFLKDKYTLSYFKLKGSFAQVGKDARPLSIYPSFEPTDMIGGGFRYGYTGPNEALKPEMNTQYEAGFESRLFNDRVNIDFGLYWTKCTDQIVTEFRLSYATGFVLNTMNVGSFTTRGVELHVDGDILRTLSGIRWNLGLNVSSTTSKVVYLPPNVSEYYDPYTWNSGNLRNGKKVGYPITSITGRGFLRNDRGDRLIDPSTGIPLVDTEWSYMGDVEPKVKFGITSTLSFRGLRLSAMFSGRLGATVVNGTKRDLMGTGYSMESVILRDSPAMILTGVLKNGLENTSNPTINTIAITNSNFGSTVYTGTDEDWMEKNVNYLCLEELRLGYTVPTKWLSKATKNLLSAAQLYVTGNSLFVLTNYSGFDPVGNMNSAALGGTSGVGWDYWGFPNPRVFTVGINLTF